jgi:hypothetical protein
MCLAVVVVAAMLVVGRESATTTVEEAATAAAEEADDGRGGWGLRVYLFLLSPIFLLRGLILWGLIFLMRQAFSKYLLHQKNRGAHNPIKTRKLHPETRKLGFTSPWVNKHKCLCKMQRNLFRLTPAGRSWLSPIPDG